MSHFAAPQLELKYNSSPARIQIWLRRLTACQMFSVSWSFLSPFSPRFSLVHLYADAHDTLSLLPFCPVDGNVGASAGLPACNVSGRFLKLSFSRRQRLVSQLQIWGFHPWCLFVHFFAPFLTSSLLCHHKPQSATCGPTLALVHGNDVSVELYQGPGEIWASQKKLQQWHCNGHSTAAMFRVARSWYSCRSWLRCHPTVNKLKYECSNWPNQHFDKLPTSQQIHVNSLSWSRDSWP